MRCRVDAFVMPGDCPFGPRVVVVIMWTDWWTLRSLMI
jgi:hypothetical protein